MTDALHIIVHGIPAAQGSKRHVGHGIMIESSKKVKPWRQDVRAAALNAEGPRFPVGGVLVGVAFRLARPKNHYRSGRFAHLLRPSAPPVPDVKPDLDKLVRSTLDALGEAGIWRDDSQVAAVWAVKEYDDRGDGVGATIMVRAAVPGQTASEPPTLRLVKQEA